MRLEELAKINKQPDGTYVAVKFSKDTTNNIKKFMEEYNIPNPLKSDNFHCTVIYSRKYLPTFEAQGRIDPPWVGTPKHMDIFTSNSNTNCLVVVFDCPELTTRHHEIMEDYDATYDYAEYKCHITLSYDCGDFDPKSIKHLKEKLGDLEIDSEYSEDLNLDWVKDKCDSED